MASNKSLKEIFANPEIQIKIQGKIVNALLRIDWSSPLNEEHLDMLNQIGIARDMREIAQIIKENGGGWEQWT